MTRHQLSFATIHLLRDDIAEVIVNDGVEMTMAMVHEYHDFLLDKLKAPFCLLINKIHSYSYDFEAQQNLANLDEINAMAVVSYNAAAKKSTQALNDNVHRENEWNLRIFDNTDSAYNWLITEQDKLTPLP